MNTVCCNCGVAIPADAPQGICPKCLVSAGLPSTANTLRTGDTFSGGIPAQDSLAEAFPQLEIIELLGKGGMGIVYKARQRKLDRLVALKILPLDASRDPSFAERFAREAKALARLSHPSIIAVHDSGQAGPYFYLLMEFVEGANLRQMLKAGQITPKEALAIVPAICDALQYAHEEGVVHRDIKPENVLLDKKGRVKIADFGLAKLLGKEQIDYALTATGAFMGTPKYMAPEQIEHPQDVDHRADIYSLGVVFYEMLTGELPLGRFAAPSKKVQVDVRLDEVVLRTLEKEPALRYQNASEVKSEVENISGMIEKLPLNLRKVIGFEYKSKASLFGLPLLHVAYGSDLRTGRKRVAKGILAFGDIAKGVIAFGGVACGGLAFGGLSLGIVAMGGLGIGLLSFSGLGLALLASYSGCALAPIAMGGFAIGIYSAGGAAFGLHPVGGNANDPAARALFAHFPFPRAMMLFLVVFFSMMLISMIGPLIKYFKGRLTSPQLP